MLKSFFLLTFMFFGFVFASPVHHPSRLDHRGMHNCWLNCEQQGFYHGEYHGHETPYDP